MAVSAIITAASSAVDMARKNPALMSKVNDYVSKAAGRPLDLSAPKAVPPGTAGAAVLLKGAVRAGVNPDTLFEQYILAEQRDGATERLLSDLRATYSRIATAEDARSVIKSDGNLSEQLFKKEIVMFAKRVYGSPQAIREAHAKMRAFLDMDTRSLEETLALHLGR